VGAHVSSTEGERAEKAGCSRRGRQAGAGGRRLGGARPADAPAAAPAHTRGTRKRGRGEALSPFHTADAAGNQAGCWRPHARKARTARAMEGTRLARRGLVGAIGRGGSGAGGAARALMLAPLAGGRPRRLWRGCGRRRNEAGACRDSSGIFSASGRGFGSTVYSGTGSQRGARWQVVAQQWAGGQAGGQAGGRTGGQAGGGLSAKSSQAAALQGQRARGPLRSGAQRVGRVGRIAAAKGP
jgi:hypothetical protein